MSWTTGQPGQGCKFIIHSFARLIQPVNEKRHVRYTSVQVIEALEREIKDSAWFGLAFLVSGFPRTLTQAKMFEDRVRPYDLVLYFDCPESVMVERLTSRGRLSGGADDSPGAIKKRISTFKSQTLPIVGYFEGIGVLQRHATALPSTVS